MSDAPSSNGASDDEPSLIERVVAGDHAAFALVMRAHNQRLYRLARATLRHDLEAQDALQEAYLRAYRSIATFRGDSTLSTWLSRLVLNECYARLRRTRRRDKVIPMVRDGDDAYAAAATVRDRDLPEQIFGRAELRALLEQKLDALPETFRVVFVLRSVEELSVEETAQVLEIPVATVRSRHFRAKSLLRESLAEAFDDAERDVFDFGGARCNRITAAVIAQLKPT
jgi:RNA polymerase sigma-70 factor (ECF subfamily)